MIARFMVNVDQAKKINRLMPKGYKLVTSEELKRRINQSKKKKPVTYVPLEIANPVSSFAEPIPPRRPKPNYIEDNDDLYFEPPKPKLEPEPAIFKP